MTLKYKIKVQNIGGSRYVMIPSPLAKTEKIEIGDIVKVSLDKVKDSTDTEAEEQKA